ncbi:hypothetical protein DPMN_170526 [Dreissena polymorpha]|uniref:Uncharacterized protein n=1 Tax=Dreissena polymorpha TaxID=45954 RepID=A0A9D4DX73_DREPO|nr:hypothetical protein DPMN_170526 [Dreissena polymorpha]
MAGPLFVIRSSYGISEFTEGDFQHRWLHPVLVLPQRNRHSTRRFVRADLCPPTVQQWCNGAALVCKPYGLIATVFEIRKHYYYKLSKSKIFEN